MKLNREWNVHETRFMALMRECGWREREKEREREREAIYDQSVSIL